jgi:hypothetical protein
MDMAENRPMVEAIHSRYGAGPLKAATPSEYDSSWDVLYPISDFLDTWQFPLAPPPSAADFTFPKPTIEHTELESLNGIRRLKFKFDFTGLVWPVLAFEAEVVNWSFDFPPPTEKKRHHLKIVASIDEPIVHFEMDVRTTRPIEIHYSALDLNQMVPGTASRRGPDMPMSKFLIEFDEWANEKWEGSLDIVCCGTVAGVVTI